MDAIGRGHLPLVLRVPVGHSPSVFAIDGWASAGLQRQPGRRYHCQLFSPRA